MNEIKLKNSGVVRMPNDDYHIYEIVLTALAVVALALANLLRGKI